ncbi:MAG: hypothetical protein HUK15_05535, partial [Bacteroidales bacterium]|nr:hypothetical protein [Bacteroidales bacterium]
LKSLSQDNSHIYDKMIFAYNTNPKIDAKSIDRVIQACIERGNIYAAQKNAAKAKEYYQKAGSIDSAKRYTSVIDECLKKLN